MIIQRNQTGNLIPRNWRKRMTKSLMNSSKILKKVRMLSLNQKRLIHSKRLRIPKLMTRNKITKISHKN